MAVDLRRRERWRGHAASEHRNGTRDASFDARRTVATLGSGPAADSRHSSAAYRTASAAAAAGAAARPEATAG